MNKNTMVRICVVGSGYVGLVAAICFAEMGHSVFCVDNDETKIRDLKQGKIPIYENLLPELLQRHMNSSCRFTTDLGMAVRESDAIFIAVGTPQGDSGSADLSYVEAVVSEIARSMDGYKTIIEKSTVPVYTNAWIRRVLERHGIGCDKFDVVSNPEFLREGTAVLDFLHPDRIVVGADTECASELLEKIYYPLVSGTYYEQENAVPGPCSATRLPVYLKTSAQSAEVIKHASNAFLAMKISFINAVARLCDAVGADVSDVSLGMGLDRRIGPSFLRAGIGYGGSCFPKDLAAFRWVAEQQGINFQLLAEVEQINEQQQQAFFDKVRSVLWTLRGKKIATLGLAFKGGTDDIRYSPAIAIIQKLIEAGAQIAAHDWAAIPRTQSILPESDSLSYYESPYDALDGADALLLLTDWKEYTELDFKKIRQLMKFPIIVDGRNLYSPDEMEALGFTYLSIGRPAVYPWRETTEAKPLPL